MSKNMKIVLIVLGCIVVLCSGVVGIGIYWFSTSGKQMMEQMSQGVKQSAGEGAGETAGARAGGRVAGGRQAGLAMLGVAPPLPRLLCGGLSGEAAVFEHREAG